MEIDSVLKEVGDIVLEVSKKFPDEALKDADTGQMLELVAKAGVSMALTRIVARGTDGYSADKLGNLGVAEGLDVIAMFMEVNNLPLIITNFSRVWAKGRAALRSDRTGNGKDSEEKTIQTGSTENSSI